MKEISVAVLAEGVLVVVLTGAGPGVVLAKEVPVAVLAGDFLCTKPVEGVPTVVCVLGYLLPLVYPPRGNCTMLGIPRIIPD